MRLVITGTSSGIGHALAVSLLAKGHEVWGLARSDQAALAASSEGRFHFSCCDVAQWAEVEAAAAEVASVWPAIDGIVTCAGLQGEIGRTLIADPARWNLTIQANLNGTFHTLRAFHSLLRQSSRRGKIVCFSGGGATKPRPNFSAYGAAKTAIVRLVETIAEEEKDSPLDINAVAPGAINTRLTDEVLALGPSKVGTAEYEGALKQKRAGGGSLERAVGLVEWLLSPASDGISGRLLSAPWDPWEKLDRHAKELAGSDVYTLRRITPEDRGKNWA